MWYSGAVKIDEHSTQGELARLRYQVTRRDFLMSTPLNIKSFLRYAVLFLLFPGMVFGFRRGMLGTACFSLLLIVLLLLGQDAAARAAISVWLAVGLAVLLYINLYVMLRARRTRESRRRMRPAQPGLKHVVLKPDHAPLSWRRTGKEQVATLVLQAPQDGIYALLLSLNPWSGARVVVEGTVGTCVVHATGNKGGAFHVLTLYSLAAGRHELSWRMAGEAAGQAELTQLNRPEIK